MTLPCALGGALLLGSIPPALHALGRFVRAASRTAPHAEETLSPRRRPAPGAARVEGLSLAVAPPVEGRRSYGRRIPGRLRGKAMGFSPFAWARGPMRATKTLAEDSEATVLLLVDGITVRALKEPFAYDEPATGRRALAAPRARWLAGHAKLAVAYGGEMLSLLSREPHRAAVLLFDLFLRPRAFVLVFLAFALTVSAALASAFLASGGVFEGALSLSAALVSGGAIALEIAATRFSRRKIRFPPEVPPVPAEGLAAAA